MARTAERRWHADCATGDPARETDTNPKGPEGNETTIRGGRIDPDCQPLAHHSVNRPGSR